MKSDNFSSYDAVGKEEHLRSEAEGWNTASINKATSQDIPVLDFGNYFKMGDESALNLLANELKNVCTHTGFFYIKGHGISRKLIDEAFEASRQFHALPLDVKMTIAMDRKDWAVGGVGYLPFQNRKLPTRTKGNANEAFIFKNQPGRIKIDIDDNQWIDDPILPDFKPIALKYAKAMESLALRMLPVYCRALDVALDYFEEGFDGPMYRLRMTKYPPIQNNQADEFGIAPHVDTTFLTILAQDTEGLVIYSEKKQQWLMAPVIEDAFIINTGELLRQWTNDQFISVKHFANNNFSSAARYSIPFFFNANAEYRMTCVPTCCSKDNPSKYPPFSYLESQASVQGE